ncbi:MAG: protein kinase [Pirellulaceae bacterium]|jgi:serine/threonine-protein kinase|nr:protein kinase [Pirellulaceae bacterium]
MNTRPLPPPSIRWPVPGEIITHGKNAYAVGEALGRGTYGATFACTDQWSNNLVVKVLVPHRQTYEQVRVNWQREIASLFTLRHPNITYVHDAFERDKTFHIVVERCGGSISTLFSIADYDGFDWIPPIARCLLQAIAFIHDHGYVHKDIHLRNVFWTYVRDELMISPTQSVTFKVGDLGVSRFAHEVQSENSTVPWMVAPEVLDPAEFGQVGKPTDLYHAGLVLLAVAMGIEPSFTYDEIVRGVPRQTAEQLPPPFGPAIGQALRRHVHTRPATAFEFWRRLAAAKGIGDEG